jgi:hypothetical protein
MEDEASSSQVPTKISPMLSAAIAYNFVELSEFKIIGEIASRRSTLALPAYVNDKPISAPILRFSS